MPRIDPLQLLTCLSVLLTPEGGILSREEVPRVVNLMTKFSKKLVSKCVYVLILKSTDTELVDMFMAEGGWTLIQTWLQDAVQTGNWDLVREILGLLLITPVDVERLKLNILPKLIKSLSRREELEGVAKLSTQLVQQWLAIVKGSSTTAMQQQQIQAAKLPQIKAEVKSEPPVEVGHHTEDKENVVEVPKENNNSEAISTADEETAGDGAAEIKEEVKEETEERNTEDDRKSDEKEKSKSSSRSSKSSSKSSRDKDKERDRRKSSGSSSKSSSSSKSKSSSSSSRDKDRKERDRDKGKHKSSSSSKSDSKSSSKSSSSKERRDSKEKDKDKHSDKEKHPEKNKEKQAEKDKDTLAKIKPQSIEKLGRIPKKPTGAVPEEKPKEVKENEVKKKSFSVGIRKDSEERPKTVKVFNSKMRSTGLEEEIKPAPPRPVKKPTPSVQLPTIPSKRPSPPREHRDPISPPEKKLKIDKVDIPERPGSIKLIPPKPKPTVLQESDLFMDALTASATAKKEPKKRKRRASVTKESPPSPTSPAREQPQSATSPTQTSTSSPSLGLKNIAPINFYQDTLRTEENAENPDHEDKENATENNTEAKEESGEEKKEALASPTTPTDDTNGEEISEPKRPRVEGGLRGVLLYTKKKGPKRSISWKNESDLVEIRYFELDETERVNVTKTFGDMAKMEMTSEREALQMSRKVVGEDSMEAQIPWRLPYLIDQADPLAVPGHKSLEKDIQFAREKSVLQALYFDKRRVPDSPEEPIPENHQMSDPIVIPLEDPETQEIDLRSTPWPEPKGSPPHVEPPLPPHVFPSVPGPFNHPFNNMPPPQFQGIPPRFPAQVVPTATPGPMGPGNFIPPNMIPNGSMMGPPNMGPPNEMMNQVPINQNMFPPSPVHDGFGPGPDFPMYNQNMPNNNMNMYPPNFNHRQGNRGGYRRGGGGGGGNSGNWVRMSGPGNWKRGGGGHKNFNRMCKNVQNHGYCRNRDNCPFVHP